MISPPKSAIKGNEIITFGKCSESALQTAFNFISMGGGASDAPSPVVL